MGAFRNKLHQLAYDAFLEGELGTLVKALDAVIRHRLKVVGVANGQRVPEDWHRLSANALMHRAMKGGGSTAYRVDVNDVQLVLSGMQRQAAKIGRAHV